MSRQSLSFKLALCIAVAALAVTVVGLFVTYLNTLNRLHDQLAAHTCDLADQIGYALEMVDIETDRFSIQRIVEQTATGENTDSVFIANRDGQVLFHNDQTQINRHFEDPLLSAAIDREERTFEFSAERFVVVDPLHSNKYDLILQSDVIGAVWVEMDLSSFDIGLQHQYALMAFILIAQAALLGLASVFIVQKHVVKRLRVLESGMIHVASGELNYRVLTSESTKNRDVISTLIAHFNQMAENLQYRTESLRESETTSRAIVDAIPDLIFRIDREGHILDFRARDNRELFLPPHKIRGLNIYQTLPGETAQIIREPIGRAFDSGSTEILEYSLPIQDEINVYEARIVRINENEVMALVRNITERTRLEQLQTDFINRASHELRTPLTTITMMVDLIQGGGDDTEMEQFWEILKLELARERELIEDLLTIGRIESGSLQLKCRPIDIVPVLRNALSAISVLADKKQLRVHVDLPDNLPLVQGDDSALKQVFQNLLGNAVKFTSVGGEIRLQAILEESNVRVSVADNGIGIPHEDLPFIFDRFFQASNAIKSRIQGSGMGLYIVRSAVEEMGGQVSVESTLGQGTTFKIWLLKSESSSIEESVKIRRTSENQT